MSTPFIFHPLENSIEVRITRECARECSHQGECDEDVEGWVKQLRKKMNRLTPELVRACLKPYGAWDEDELADHEQNLRRLLWLAAGQVKEEKSCWVYFEGY